MAGERGAAPDPLATVVPVYQEMTHCRVCEATPLEPVLDLGMQWLANFVRVRDTSLPKAPLELVRCTDCGTLQLKHSVQGDLMWRDYWYRSGVNQTMRDALQDVVTEGCRYAKEGAWLDIGANDGTLLSRVGDRFTKVACEPALNMHPLLEEHADYIVPDYFSANRVRERCDRFDVITSCAMFYDLDRPGAFVKDIAEILAPDGVWINQLNDAPTMLRCNAFDAICHEHVCYYDVPTLKRLYASYGLSIVGLSYNTINGGSMRIAAMKSRAGPLSSTMGVRPTSPEEVTRFASRVMRWKTVMTDLLSSKTAQGEVWGLGASTKGCCLLQYLGVTDRFVAIGDRNPAKYGMFMAGSWLPVTDELTMRRAKPSVVVPLIWGFRGEILQREEEMRHAGTVFLMPLPNPEFIL